jgi:hypothetical protein
MIDFNPPFRHGGQEGVKILGDLSLHQVQVEDENKQDQ